VKERLHVLAAIDEPPDPLWQRLSPLAQTEFVREGLSAYHQLTSRAYDLAFLDLKLLGLDGLELLRRVKGEQLCPAVVLTSLHPSFPYAQQGILYGASAYLLRPLQEREVEEVFRKVLTAFSDPVLTQGGIAVAQALRHGTGPQTYLRLGRHPQEEDPITQALFWRDLYCQSVNQVYVAYPWLKLYHAAGEFAALDWVQEADPQMVQTFCLQKLTKLGQILTTLFPPAQDKQLEEIEVALLTSIDQDPQQKDIAEQFYLASSTLSARFQRQLGISYREYLTRLKVCRAQYLLTNTNLPLGEIPRLLGYKDKEYFTKLFAQRTGTPFRRTQPSQWAGENI
jgi:two-component system response regulator YesN